MLEDLKYFAKVRTYQLTTLGFTSVVFCTGSASWWTPQMMTFAYGIQNNVDDVPKDEVTHISVTFGIITCCAGIIGIITGSTIAQIFMFLAVTSMCFNFAVNMDILMYVIVPNRRATATAIQSLFSHLFGDASSPYIIGFISDSIRGDRTTSLARYYALQYAMFLPNAVLIISIGCYLWATFYVVNDHHRAKEDMHAIILGVSVEDEWSSDVETLASNVRRTLSDTADNPIE
ncbi:unnamed protein product [Cylicostephanus goldi]|uniref:Major facilitator superfamily (MFS) profile domain-containing protein n=1 Tax=Cylicostephanus goldi TaxID=71465 RepID=A0A3P7QC63_CYLGO|nr:unnamed protein product [Cylicostephanus goldi]